MDGRAANTNIPTREDIEVVIKRGDPATLIGFEETAYFEVKERSYATDAPDKLTKNKAIQTLTTDISSIANSGGGYLFIGLKTTRKAGQPTEYVSSVCGVKREHVPLDKWRLIVREYTTPRLTLEAIEHGFIGKVVPVFWMKIPNAKSTGEYPVLVTKAKWQVDDDTFLDGELYGLYHRDGAENLLESPDKIQKILAAGTQRKSSKEDITTAQYQRLSEQLDALATTIGSMGGAGTRIDAEVVSKLAEADAKIASNQGYFYIYARPRKPMQFSRFWDNDMRDENTVYMMLKNPPTLRNMGWDLRVAMSEYPHPTNGSSWEITNGNRKLLQVSDNGTIFGALSVEGVLNWSSESYIPKGSNINALVNELALTEYIYNFIVFANELSKGRGKVHDFDLVYGFKVPDGVVLGLLRSRMIMILSYEVDGRLGKVADWHGELYMGIPPAKQAADIVLNIIRAGFGIADNPPFVRKDQTGFLVVDTEFYKKIGT